MKHFRRNLRPIRVENFISPMLAKREVNGVLFSKKKNGRLDHEALLGTAE
jgi:hypothetical protein